MYVIDLIGHVAAILILISLVPQLVKTIRTRKTRDLSLWRYIIYVAGLFLMLVYGILGKLWPIMILNSIAFIFAMTILTMKIRYG